MAINLKGYRKIIVNDKIYRWKIKRCTWILILDPDENKPRKHMLEDVFFDLDYSLIGRMYHYDTLLITPKHIAKFIISEFNPICYFEYVDVNINNLTKLHDILKVLELGMSIMCMIEHGTLSKQSVERLNVLYGKITNIYGKLNYNKNLTTV